VAVPGQRCGGPVLRFSGKFTVMAVNFPAFPSR